MLAREATEFITRDPTTRAGRGRGRERWWEVPPEPVWIPRDGLGVEAQAEVSGLGPARLAEDLEGFARFRAARAAMGEWSRGTWAAQRVRLTLTREQAAQLIADQQQLIRRCQRDAADTPDAEPAPDDTVREQ